MKFVVSLFTVFTIVYFTQSQNVSNMDYFHQVSTCHDHSFASFKSYLVTGESRFTCALTCVQEKECRAYSVDKKNDRCDIYQTPISADICGDDFTYYNSMKPMNIPCENGGLHVVETDTCTCFNSYVGDRCERLMKDCSDGFKSGHYMGQKTVFDIQLSPSAPPIKVYCEMEYGGELFFMRHTNNNPSENFTRGIDDYVNGFGDLNSKNFWLGLDKIHQISSSGPQTLIVQTYASDFFVKQRFYFNFVVRDASNGYSFTFTSHSPNNLDNGVHTLDDCLEELRNQSFSALDEDNDSSPGNCAQTFKSGWWFRDCARCNPTGVFQPTSEEYVSADPTFMSWPLPTNRSTLGIHLFLVEPSSPETSQ